VNEVARKRDFWKSGLESYFSYFHGAAGFCILLPIGLVETLGEAIPFRSAAAGFMSLAGVQIGDDLVDPFANCVHDLPLTSVTTMIERICVRRSGRSRRR